MHTRHLVITACIAAGCGPKVVGSLAGESEGASSTADPDDPGASSTGTSDDPSTGPASATSISSATATSTTTGDPAPETTTGNNACTENCPAAAQVAISYNHTCVLVEDGRLRCWGLGLQGAPGLGHTDNIGDDEIAAVAPDVDAGGEVAQVVTDGGGSVTCVRFTDGDVKCWGGQYEYFGILGRPDSEWIGDDELPSSIAPIELGGPAVKIALGGTHACALMRGGAVRCWGGGLEGGLGYGNPDNIGDDEHPSVAGDVDVGEPVLDLTLGGGNFTCALLDAGRVRCWGNGSNGSLGYGIFDPMGPPQDAWIGDDEIPASMGDVPVGGAVTQIVAGAMHVCALLDTGGVRCWGENYAGCLGYGAAVEGNPAIGDDETPASMGDVPLGRPAVQLGAGDYFTCALLDNGAIRCWGDADEGRLGISDPMLQDTAYMTPDQLPDVIIGGAVASLVVTAGRACAVMQTGALRCWGRNLWGQHGYGHIEAIGDDEHPADAGDVPYLP